MVRPATVPERYAAALPASSSAIQGWTEDASRYPPMAHSIDALLAGNPDFLERLAASARRVPAADRATWVKAWHGLLRFETPTIRFCENVRSTMAAPPSLPREVLAISFGEACRSTADRSLILREDTPPEGVVAYFDTSASAEVASPPPFSPRLAQAVRDVVSKGGFDARRAAFTLIALREPEAEQALIAIYRDIGDPEVKSDVGMAFHYGRTAEAKSLARSACAAKPRDAMCGPDPIIGLKNDGGAVEPNPPAPDPAKVRRAIDRLAGLGFTRVAALDPAAASSDDAEVLLLESSHAHGFDVETGMFPNQHDRLLRQLAALVSPALDGAVFEEVAPKLNADDEPTGPYRLRGYDAGKVFEIEAKDLGDWYDVDAVLALMEAMLTNRKSPLRLLPLATRDQTLIIVGGPQAALARATAEGLIETGDPGRAEAAGKAFERQVLKKLRGGTHKD